MPSLLSGSDILNFKCLQDLLSVRPQEESMSPYSGSGLQREINP